MLAAAQTKTTQPFDQIPEWLASRTELSAEAKLLFARILGYLRRLGRVFPGQARLARELGLGSDRAVRRLLTELREHGLVETTRRGYNRTLIYHVVELHPWLVEYEAARTPRPAAPPQGDFFSPSVAGTDRRAAPPIQTQEHVHGHDMGSSSTRARARLRDEEEREFSKVAPGLKEPDERSALVDRIIETIQQLASLGAREPIRSLGGYQRALLTHDVAMLRQELAEQQAHLETARNPAPPAGARTQPRKSGPNETQFGAREEALPIEPGYELNFARGLAHAGHSADTIVERLVACGVDPCEALCLAGEAIDLDPGSVRSVAAVPLESDRAWTTPIETLAVSAAPDATPTTLAMAEPAAAGPGASPLAPPSPESAPGSATPIAQTASSTAVEEHPLRMAPVRPPSKPPKREPAKPPPDPEIVRPIAEAFIRDFVLRHPDADDRLVLERLEVHLLGYGLRLGRSLACQTLFDVRPVPPSPIADSPPSSAAAPAMRQGIWSSQAPAGYWASG